MIKLLLLRWVSEHVRLIPKPSCSPCCSSKSNVLRLVFLVQDHWMGESDVGLRPFTPGKDSLQLGLFSHVWAAHLKVWLLTLLCLQPSKVSLLKPKYHKLFVLGKKKVWVLVIIWPSLDCGQIGGWLEMLGCSPGEPPWGCGNQKPLLYSFHISVSVMGSRKVCTGVNKLDGQVQIRQEWSCTRHCSESFACIYWFDRHQTNGIALLSFLSQIRNLRLRVWKFAQGPRASLVVQW